MEQLKDTRNSTPPSSLALEVCERCGRPLPEEAEAYLLGGERRFCPVCGWEVEEPVEEVVA